MWRYSRAKPVCYSAELNNTMSGSIRDIMRDKPAKRLPAIPTDQKGKIAAYTVNGSVCCLVACSVSYCKTYKATCQTHR